MNTLTTVLARANVSVPDDTIADIVVPVLSGPQRQGDVGIFPRQKLGKAERASFVEVRADGVAIVRGEATGNTHLLMPDPGCRIMWAPNPSPVDGDVSLGVLDVPEGAIAWLIHTDEHGANGIGAGTYIVHGKREMSDEIRRVAD